MLVRLSLETINLLVATLLYMRVGWDLYIVTLAIINYERENET